MRARPLASLRPALAAQAPLDTAGVSCRDGDSPSVRCARGCCAVACLRLLLPSGGIEAAEAFELLQSTPIDITCVPTPLSLLATQPLDTRGTGSCTTPNCNTVLCINRMIEMQCFDGCRLLA